MKHRILCLTVVLAIWAGAASAQNLALPPAAQSPHWPHIRIFDYARSLFLAPLSQPDKDWYATHLDAIEVGGNGPAVRAVNPSIDMFSYWFDQSDYKTANFSGLSEEGFLHFSEATTLEFWDMSRTTLLQTVNIAGCPGTITKSCRVQTMLWSNARYVFNPQSTAFKVWRATKLLSSRNVYGANVDTSKLVWVDEHAPGFSWPLSFGWQTIITAGGSIKEFGGRKPVIGLVQDETFETDYGDAVTAWLSYAATRAASAGKRIVINTNREALHPAFGSTLQDQALAIKGFATEGKHMPDGFTDPADYQAWLALSQSITTAGGTVDLSTEWCNEGPAGYTAGNYESPAQRFRMWRLASYYHFKEPVGSTGRVYFNPGFCSNLTPAVDNASLDQDNWAPAYQVDVGVPTGNVYVYQSGTVNGCAYTVLARDYSKALILVRPKDSTGCNTYDDSSSAVVTFPYHVRILPHGGDLTGQPCVTAFGLRNAEALIAIKP